MKTLCKLAFLWILLLLTGCVSQYSISERELESYLGDEVKFEVSQGHGPFAIEMHINDIDVALGQKPDTMAVTAKTKISLKNPLLPLSTYLSTTFEAKPWYDANTQSIYLKDLQLTDLHSSPKEIASAVQHLVPQLMGFLTTTLESQPVYVLDSSDTNQAKIADIAQSFEVQPGKLVVKFKP